MKTYTITVNSKKFLGDLLTPVGIYPKVRDLYVHSILLESSDYNSIDRSNSYIAFNPIASFSVKDGVITTTTPDGQSIQSPVRDKNSVPDAFLAFTRQFEISKEDLAKGTNGFFGYSAYEAVQYYEDVQLHAEKLNENDLPEIHYEFFKYVITFNHYKNEICIIENLLHGETESALSVIEKIINNPIVNAFDFHMEGEEQKNISDEEYKQMVRKGKDACQRGDVFQIVLSRRFSQGYRGDDFMLYRTLRSINPSPYLFYFDFGSYRIFGSSPEVHLRIANHKAHIMPIAGTMKRTGKDEEDEKIAEQLLHDPKENAEHIMLVDLARNDLSRNTENVHVESLRTVQYYSHVIHLVSSVVGTVPEGSNTMRLFADTFPAGTLSGAPKVRAMQLIDSIESHDRGFYGGCIGIVGLDGSCNQAITIRSFLSRNNRLYYQAGAGIVARSDEESELQEVNNKLAALRRAMHIAQEY